MKTILTKKPGAFKSLLFKAALCCCVFMLLQANKSMAQYVRVELSNPNRYIGPNVVYDYCDATIQLFTDATCTTPYTVSTTGGIDVNVYDTVIGSTTGSYTTQVHVDQGNSTALLPWSVVLHYWEFSTFDPETNTNYDLNGQYTDHITGDVDTVYDFYYDFDYTLYPGPITW